MSLCTTACGFDRGRIEGQIQYVDSRWDPAGAPLPVPPLLVHVMPGTEVMRRDILSAYAAVVARGIPGKDVAGIVE